MSVTMSMTGTSNCECDYDLHCDHAYSCGFECMAMTLPQNNIYNYVYVSEFMTMALHMTMIMICTMIDNCDYDYERGYDHDSMIMTVTMTHSCGSAPVIL